MLKKIIITSILILFCIIPLLISKKGEENVCVIQFASWGSESEINILKPILKDFEKENPNIRVNFMHIPQNYFQKIHLLFASNTSPDVIFINNLYLPIYANAGVLEPLNDKNFELKNFYQKSLDSLSWRGKIYAIPRDLSNIVIFYNKSLFKKYNVPYPSENWDLEEFLSNAQQLTHKPDLYGISFDETPLLYLPYLTTCGGWNSDDTKEFFTKDVLSEDINKKSLQFYADLRNKYHVAPLKNESASATMAQMFLQGKLGMQVSGRWLVPKYRQEAKFDWDVAEFPSCVKGEKSVVPMDSSGWAISQKSKHKKEALKLIKYLSSRESIEKFTKSGLITPARIDVAESNVFLDNDKPKNAKVFLNAAQNSIPTPVTVNYGEIIDALKSKNEYMFNTK